MRKLITLAAVAVVSISPARAESLKPGYPVCLTEDLLEQDHDAVFKKDIEALVWLSNNGCTVSGAGVHVTVLELSSWGSMAHIRVYHGKHAVEVWTDRQAVDGYDPLNLSSSR